MNNLRISPLSSCKNLPPLFFHGAFAPSFTWRRRPWVYVSIFYRFRDVAGYLSKVADFDPPHLHLVPPQGVTPVEFRGDLWHQKTTVFFIQTWSVRPPVSVFYFSPSVIADRHRHVKSKTCDRGKNIKYTVVGILQVHFILIQVSYIGTRTEAPILLLEVSIRYPRCLIYRKEPKMKKWKTEKQKVKNG